MKCAIFHEKNVGMDPSMIENWARGAQIAWFSAKGMSKWPQINLKLDYNNAKCIIFGEQTDEMGTKSIKTWIKGDKKWIIFDEKNRRHRSQAN